MMGGRYSFNYQYAGHKLQTGLLLTGATKCVYRLRNIAIYCKRSKALVTKVSKAEPAQLQVMFYSKLLPINQYKHYSY